MKTNIKIYKPETLSVLRTQLWNKTHVLCNMYDPKYAQDIVNVCYDIAKNADTITRYWFIHTFFGIIKETATYYTTLPYKLKGYYKEIFVEKLRTKYMRHLEENIKDENALTHFNCLFTAFIRENVYSYWK